jgi:hypothetical protein
MRLLQIYLILLYELPEEGLVYSQNHLRRVHFLRGYKLSSSRHGDRCLEARYSFPDDEEKPRFIWVDCLVEEKLDDKGKKTHFEQCAKSVQKYLGDGRLFAQLKRPEFEPDERLELLCRKTHCIDGPKENKSIMNILKKFPRRDWRGPFIVLRELANDNEEYSEYITYQDVKLENLQAIVRFFKTWDRFGGPFAEISSEDGFNAAFAM